MDLLRVFGICLVVVFVLFLLIYVILGLRIISSDQVAVVEKWWSFKGSLKDSIIALNGEAGYAPMLLRGGIHFRTTLMYKIHKYPLITIPQGQIAYIFARDGKPLEPIQTLGKVIAEANNFQDVTGFLKNGGQRGPQRGILREGTYAINLAQFIVITPTDIKAVFNSTKNERVELITMQKTLLERNAFSFGKEGKDTTGDNYKHGELVGEGCKGVLEKPLMPGKYAFNTDAGKVVLVPTTNIILKWNKSEVGSHKYDENLTEVDIITKDAFEPSLPLSVVMHIDYKQAPWVIQRFGDINMLVNQSLDPLVSAYFKDVAQTKTLIELIQERSEIRERALGEMMDKFHKYNLQLEEVLIVIYPIEKITMNLFENICRHAYIYMDYNEFIVIFLNINQKLTIRIKVDKYE